jgi:hypothetical protein
MQNGVAATFGSLGCATAKPALEQAPVCLKEVTRKAEARHQQSHTLETMFVQ